MTEGVERARAAAANPASRRLVPRWLDPGARSRTRPRLAAVDAGLKRFDHSLIPRVDWLVENG